MGTATGAAAIVYGLAHTARSDDHHPARPSRPDPLGDPYGQGLELFCGERRLRLRGNGLLVDPQPGC
ncbi:hypothetical protein ACQP0U_21555 [Micromonospora sp. CA-269861]|uniref:hypothetical protein n=1 Tax=Micromonospora sp. CA-269861 TaxID=3239968 RepID=UPI003D8CDF79